ncbi:DeoR/GlpR family DNA-binding transcription regulator [Gracilibacillus alcaliphilus]|uniref:DeoR/GlpR family DNA-binding transcription regulator n=1 Tax=Gracilibacillus alcaliphilus TaxID=1401441 RepID=UPI00195A8B7E|nr:DeoR family fructose operon transcriptional repressor [Gracilibacillus alcaliphilus]
MLTIERQELILSLLKEQEVVKVKDICELTQASESTIRRDLTELERKQYIKRVHGGASLIKKKREEPTFLEKQTKNYEEKQAIAKKAASFIETGDSIYLDAGSSSLAMIPFLQDKSVVVVTNGIPHVQLLIEQGIDTYVIAGKAKQGTAALTGTKAVESVREYRFDKCFLGMNGIHLEQGLTTPDPEEASVKRAAIDQSLAAYVLADSSKFGEISFANVGDLSEVSIVTTNHISEEQQDALRKYTSLEVVSL